MRGKSGKFLVFQDLFLSYVRCIFGAEIGGNLYHICEFAERMAHNGATYEPKQADAPPRKEAKHKDYER